MNGLLGIYTKQDTETSKLKQTLEKGLDTLAHRGSKTRMTFLMNKEMQHSGATDSDSCIALGACSAENNTSHIISKNGRLIFFDGRLTNRDKLFKLLSNQSDNGITDTEIVLMLMEKFGTDCFKQLRGFWSLIILDLEKKIFYGAKDPFGCRPMYYCLTNKQFALASESRTLYTLFQDARSINKNTVIDYLLWGNIGSVDQYFFKDIHSIEPSHFVKYEIENDKLSIERYYTLPYNRSSDSFENFSEKKYLDGLRNALTNSVKSNIQLYDGPLAVGVSGGMDSSSLICTAKKLEPKRTLVAYTTTDTYDGGESIWAEKIIKYTGAEWIKVVCTSEQILEKLEEVNKIHNVPLYNASSLAQYRIMEEIKKQGQAVFIDGQGGDEMLGGYPAYFPLFFKQLRNNGEWSNWRKELSQVTNSGMTKKELFMRRLKLWAKANYYTPYRLAKKAREPELQALQKQQTDTYFHSPSPINEIKKEVLNDALFESYTIFLGNILRWGEHSAAANGIECVMPLSDDLALTEFVFSIPSSYKIHNGWNKYLLRKAMVGTVPDDICWRKQKMGFYIPEQHWLDEIGNAMRDTIEKLEDTENCIDKKYILENWNSLFVSNNPIFKCFIFRCYSYLLWRNGLD